MYNQKIKQKKKEKIQKERKKRKRETLFFIDLKMALFGSFCIKKLILFLIQEKSTTMACKAIKEDHLPCRNSRQEDSVYCYAHREMTPEIYKERWFQRYILGNRPDHDRIFYFREKEENSPTQPILEPLRSGEIKLTEEDIARIPVAERYIDVFLLLVENEFADWRENKKLANRVLIYYIHLQILEYEYGFRRGLRRLANALTGSGVSSIRVIERLLQKDWEVLVNFMYKLPRLLQQKFSDYQNTEEVFLPILTQLSECEAQREASWYTKSGSLLDHYNKYEVGKAFLPFLKDVFYPKLDQLLKEEKKVKYARSNIFKEELMMNRWHPDRIWKHLEMGIDVDDM